MAFIGILLIVAFAICRLQVKRGWALRRSGGWGLRLDRHPRVSTRHLRVTRADLDLYFAYLQRVDSLAERFNGINYNDNGVQIIGAPPPYSDAVRERAARQERPEPPPPYVEDEPRLVLNEANQARVISNNHQDPRDPAQAQPLLENNNNEDPEDNNNGDINGNSDMIDHNEVRRRELQVQEV